MKKPAKKKAAPRKAKPVARMKAKPKSGVARAAKPKLKPLAPVLGKLISATTDKPRIDLLKVQDALKPAERAELLRLAPRPDDTRWPSEITVGKRFRRDMGDLDALARSIEKRTRDGKPGLQQPIGINPKGELIWGERRLLAWKRANVALEHPIPVRVMDITSIIVGEYVENDPKLRKNFSPSESVEIFEAMRPRERELVGAELAARPTEQRPAPGRKASGAKAGRADDRAAKFTGKDRTTIAKAKDVVDAARADPKYQPLVEQMDRTGKVDGPHRRLKIMRQTEAIRAAPPQWPAGDHRYETAVIDFPWPHEPEMDQEQIDAAGRSLRPYPAMSIKNGAHFMREQLGPRLAEKCTIYFWCTNYHLPWAEHLLGALGFTRPCTMGTWAKDQVGRGQVLRDQTEQCIVRHRGGALIAETMDTTLWQGAGWETRENSRKPQAFYDLVERKSPAARYLSVFSRGGEGDKWDSYGDQAEAFAAPAASKDDREEWKALGAIEGGVTIEGPVFTALQALAYVTADAGAPGGWVLTPDGADRLAALDVKFSEEKLKAQQLKLLQLLETIVANPHFEPAGAEPWLLEQLAELVKYTPGGYRSKPRRRLTAWGRKHLAKLQEMFPAPAPETDEHRLQRLQGEASDYLDGKPEGEGNSPPEDPQPADRADARAEPEKGVLPAHDPALTEAAVKAGHVFSMTIDWTGAGDSLKGGTSVATCQCGVVFRAARSLPQSGHEALDVEIERHWRDVLRERPAQSEPDDAGPMPEILRRKPAEVSA